MAIDVQMEPQALDPPVSDRGATIDARDRDRNRAAVERSRPARPWKGILFLVFLTIVIGALSFWFSGPASPGKTAAQMTHTIGRGDLKVSVTEQGTLESSDNKEIRCKVQGTSTVIWVVDAGTQVKPGDVLVKLDRSQIEDKINQQKIAYEKARADFTQAETDASVAKIAITEYVEGTFQSELKTLQKDQKVAESNLRAARNMLEHTTRMFRKGYVSQLEVERQQFAVEQAQLELDVKNTAINVLEKFTKVKKLEELQGALTAAQAKLASATAALELEKARLDRENRQLENCTIRAENSGMVIYPSAAEWRETPDITEGATVREDQVLLMIPDLSKMQVKVGIHESRIDQITIGMPARVKMRDTTINGKVSKIASVTRPTGWWTGNIVKYDTIIALDSQTGLRPGMSAEVDVIIANHQNVVTIPVAAVLEQDEKHFCWVKTENSSAQRRALKLGDSNDQFIVVKDGVKEGDKVILNPLAYVDDAQRAALKPADETKSQKNSKDNKTKSKQSGSELTAKQADHSKGSQKSESKS